MFRMGQLLLFCIAHSSVCEFLGFKGYKTDLISWACISNLPICIYPLYTAKCYQNPSKFKPTLCFLWVTQSRISLFKIFMSFKRRAYKVLRWHNLLVWSVKHFHNADLNPEGFTDYCIASSYKSSLSRKGNTEKTLISEPLTSLFMLLVQPPIGYEPSSLLPVLLFLLPPELFPSS